MRAARASIAAGTAARSAAAATAVSVSLLNKLNFTTIDFGVIQFLKGSLHVRTTGELNNAFILVLLMSISISDISSLAHVILEVSSPHVTSLALRHGLHQR
eukprot:GHVO01023608.1.p3 GENE.GHVO01023608.1~~GHVO01023608.1.p3  ORF type:complete len:101 (-),score=5.31 GHVO01023608.1:140-442(-)